MSPTVLMISPGFPAEMPLFTVGLARVGARVVGLGDQAPDALGEDVRRALSAYVQVPNLWDEDAVVGEVARRLGGRTVDRVECLWEPGMVLAAKLRRALGAPGLDVERTLPFRDKELMKQKLDAAGVRTPHHYRARTKDEVRTAAERIGWPVIVKPIAGAGSADTYPLREHDELERALAALDHVQEVSVEEYVEGDEFTFDTVSVGGQPLFHNVALYRPKPLVARLNPWISPQAVCLRDTAAPELSGGVELGLRVLEALEFESGFSHMEWFRTPSGEAIFGEIGARAPGGRLVHVMNYSCEADLFTGWAEAVCHGKLSQDVSRRHNAAVIFKRAEGPGQRITRIEGLEALMARFGEHVANVELVRVGEPRRDWRQVVVGDGWVVVRHPELQTTFAMADRFSTDLRLHAD